MTLADFKTSIDSFGDIGEISILVYFLLVNTFYLILLISATAEMRRHRARVDLEERWRLLGSDVAPRVSVLAPAYNEAATVIESVRALLLLQYPGLEVVLVSDGSTDDTVAVLQEAFDLVPVFPIYRRTVETKNVRSIYRSATQPGLVVVDKDNGGKADALNTALNIASGDLVCAIDADTLIESNALLLMARPFLTKEDVAAVGGTIRIANGSLIKQGRVIEARAPRRALPGIQTIEYLRAFLFGRLGWNRFGGNLIISGALGMFRKDLLLKAGGYLHETVGEDIEIVARIRRTSAQDGSPGRIEFVPDPVAWTEVPESFGPLGRQRDRWHRGLSDVLWRYRHLMANPKYGTLGTVALPYFFLVELLAPVVEACGLLTLVIAIGVGETDFSFMFRFFLVVYGYGLVLNTLAIALDEFSFRRYHGLIDRVLLFCWAILESLGYRQLTVVWRLKGIVGFLRKRTEWGAMTRTGFAQASSVK